VDLIDNANATDQPHPLAEEGGLVAKGGAPFSFGTLSFTLLYLNHSNVAERRAVPKSQR
jgi:hypothetical protein